MEGRATAILNLSWLPRGLANRCQSNGFWRVAEKQDDLEHGYRLQPFPQTTQSKAYNGAENALVHQA
jgi:hypothetical protein